MQFGADRNADACHKEYAPEYPCVVVGQAGNIDSRPQMDENERMAEMISQMNVDT